MTIILTQPNLQIFPLVEILIESTFLLPFIRKTCQACKCPRESHAIYHQQLVSVRERLGFKPELQASKIDPHQLGYAWGPPGVLTSAKVQKYFDSLASDKVPKLGASGEQYRDKQLSYQLPKQDLALAYCKHVEPQNRSSYEDFVSARNEIALDIGELLDSLLTELINRIKYYFRLRKGCTRRFQMCRLSRSDGEWRIVCDRTEGKR